MIVSIPHTGTNFVKAFFRGIGLTPPNYHIRLTVDKAQYMTPYNKGVPVVIPLRDPAENMLSHWLRGRRNAQAFRELAQDWNFVAGMDKAFFLPIDNGADRRQRKRYLRGATRLHGVDPEDHKEFIDAYARQWTPLNRLEGTADARTAYRAGKMDKFKSIAPQIWDALQTVDPELFYIQGYGKFKWDCFT